MQCIAISFRFFIFLRIYLGEGSPKTGVKIGLIGVSPNAVAAPASLTELWVEKMQCIAMSFRKSIFLRIYLGEGSLNTGVNVGPVGVKPEFCCSSCLTD